MRMVCYYIYVYTLYALVLVEKDIISVCLEFKHIKESSDILRAIGLNLLPEMKNQWIHLTKESLLSFGLDFLP